MIVRLARDVDYCIAMDKKVHVERIIHEGMPDDQKTESE